MANSYSALGFWRAWHRSCNQAARAATSIQIFTFVALWNNLSSKLLAFGWLAALFIVPEVVVTREALAGASALVGTCPFYGSTISLCFCYALVPSLPLAGSSTSC